MRFRPVLLAFVACLLAESVRLGAAISDKIERTFPVQPGCEVRIDSYRGAIHVEQGDTPEVRVVVEINISGKTEAIEQGMRAGLNIDIQGDARGVSVVGRNPREQAVRFVWEEDNEIDLAYRVTIPRGSKLTLRVINGSMVIGNVAADISARVENGTVFFRQIEGSVKASVDIGDIVISRCTGELHARVLRGLLRAGTLFGKADLKNGSGDVEIMSAQSEVIAHAEAGDLWAGFPNKIGGPARLSAFGGNIRVQIDPAASCAIDAAASWGRVRTKVPMTFTRGRSGDRSLTAVMNQGGPTLTFRASGGHVTIDAGETYFE